MPPRRSSLTTTLRLEIPAPEAFELFAGDLTGELHRRHIFLEPASGGRILEGGDEIGRVKVWEPGSRLSLRMRSAFWMEGGETTITFTFKADGKGTKIAMKVSGMDGLVDGEQSEILGLFARITAADTIGSLSTESYLNWYMDRQARRPSGAKSTSFYADPLYHWPNFFAILDEIKLTAEDNLLEVGCGGGAFVRAALESGCRATALDFSPEQIRVAKGQNSLSLEQGRLSLLEADASRLPLVEGEFTCAVMTGVLDFLPDPVSALSEIRRALRPGGRMVVYVSSPDLKGTPASPEPFASRLRFYGYEEVLDLASQAGFDTRRLASPDFEYYSRKAGIPEEAMEMFKGKSGGVLLCCVKS